MIFLRLLGNLPGAFGHSHYQSNKLCPGFKIWAVNDGLGILQHLFHKFFHMAHAALLSADDGFQFFQCIVDGVVDDHIVILVRHGNLRMGALQTAADRLVILGSCDPPNGGSIPPCSGA